MEYSPRTSNPYVSRVDAGVVELVRSFGCEVVSSGDLIQLFEATWDDEQWKLHLVAARVTDAAYGVAWKLIAERTRGGGSVLETEVQRAILDHFAANSVTTYSPPIVAANALHQHERDDAYADQPPIRQHQRNIERHAHAHEKEPEQNTAKRFDVGLELMPE